MLRKKITEVLVEQIHANRQQPRKHFEKMQLEELRDSICQFGILQPLILRREEDGSYMILAGERRFRAAVMAGLTKVPALVREASEEEAGMIALVENIQRENLGYIEEAKAYQTLMETYSIPQQELARRLGKNQSTISNKIRILNLPEDIQHLLVEHRLTERHARALLKLDDDEMRRQVIEKVIRHQFNVRQTEKLVEECLVRREKLEREKKKIMRISCKLYINTLKKTFNEMNLLSRGATFRQEDTGESYVVKITIPKIPEEQEMLHEKAKRHNGCKWSVIHALMTRAFIVLPPKKHNVSRETLCFFYDDGRKRVVKKSVMLYNRITAEKKSAKLLR